MAPTRNGRDRGAIAQVRATEHLTFVNGARELEEILGLDVVQASLIPRLIVTVPPRQDFSREQTLRDQGPAGRPSKFAMERS